VRGLAVPEQRPQDRDVVPIEVKSVHFEVKIVSIEVEIVSIEVDIVHFEVKIVSIEVDIVPIEMKIVPVEVDIVPIEMKIVPIEVDIVPIEIKDAEDAERHRLWARRGGLDARRLEGPLHREGHQGGHGVGEHVQPVRGSSPPLHKHVAPSRTHRRSGRTCTGGASSAAGRAGYCRTARRRGVLSPIIRVNARHCRASSDPTSRV
jgi:hypothetical protein